MKSLYSSLLFLALAFALVLVGCVGTNPSVKTPAQHAAVALDTTMCAATDILPEVPAMVEHLAKADSSVAQRAILGILGGTTALAKGVACYLRAQASMRIQSGDQPCVPINVGRDLLPGEQFCKTDVDLIRNRAEACLPEGCGRQQLYSVILCQAEASGYVVLMPRSRK